MSRYGGRGSYDRRYDDRRGYDDRSRNSYGRGRGGYNNRSPSNYDNYGQWGNDQHSQHDRRSSNDHYGSQPPSRRDGNFSYSQAPSKPPSRYSQPSKPPSRPAQQKFNKADPTRAAPKPAAQSKSQGTISFGNKPAQKKPAPKPKPAPVVESESESDSDEDDLSFVCDDLQINYKQLSKWLQKNGKELSAFWLSTYNQICAFQGQDPAPFNLQHKHFKGQFLKHIRKAWGVPEFLTKDSSEFTLFLLTELQSVKMIGPKDYVETETKEEFAATAEVKAISSKLAKLCNNLPVTANDGVQIVQQLQTYVRTQCPQDYISKTLLAPNAFDELQANVITEINNDFNQQYTARKHMLRVRLNATVESMKQSTKVTKKDLREIDKKLEKLMSGLEDSVDLEVWSIFCAQADLFREDKINTNCVDNQMRKYRIPHLIPDRGGRPGAIRKKDVAPSNWGGQGGGQRGGKRGYNNRQGGYNRQGGGYNNRRRY